MKNLYLSLLSGLIAIAGIAQNNYVHQVLFLNEGQYDYFSQQQLTPVSLGSYNPQNQTYNDVATLSAVRFASDIVVNGNNIYIAADNKLYVMDKNNYQMVDSIEVEGIRKLAIDNGRIAISRGEYQKTFASYFQVYDLTSLNLIFELDTINGPKYAAEGIAIVNNKAYVAINNAFVWGEEKGLMGVIDLATQSYELEVNLGAAGINPDNLMVDANTIYTLNNKDWTGSSVTVFNTNDNTHTTHNLSAPSGCGSSVYANNKVYYHRYDYNAMWVDTNTQILRFDPLNQTMDTTAASVSGLYGMVDDKLNNQLYVTTTDFSTSGTAHIMDYNGNVNSSFTIGVSAGNIAFDIRTTVDISEQADQIQFGIYPNPATDIIQLTGNTVENIIIRDVIGNVVLNSTISNVGTSIDLSRFSRGTYFVEASGNGNTAVKKMVIH